jgi:hypothetical protein
VAGAICILGGTRTFSGNHADLGDAVHAGNALTMADGTINANTALVIDCGRALT